MISTIAAVTRKIRGNKITARRDIFRVCAGVVLSAVPVVSLQAFPFPVSEARSAAMGGISVAGDAGMSAFSNPALAAQTVENVDWILTYPSLADLSGDTDAFEKKLNPALPEYDGEIHRLYEGKGMALIIPDAEFGGFIYYTDRLYHSATISNSATTLTHRAVKIHENGFAMARTMAEPDLPLYGFTLGVTIKLVTYRAFGYDAVLSTDYSLDDSRYNSPSSAVNFDIGVARELGVWKMGLVVKDILNYDQEYSNTGETYKILPQTRMGFSYHSRNTFWEVDIDLTKNTDIATASESQFIALGWEYRLIKPLTIRLGYNNNSVGDQLQTTSAGFGLTIGMFQADFATLKNDQESGAYMQLTTKF